MFNGDPFGEKNYSKNYKKQIRIQILDFGTKMFISNIKSSFRDML
jgi:hypothetical protein